MNRKYLTFAVTGILFCTGFAFGYFFQSLEISKKDLFIANTVGNNLSEVNRLYLQLNKQGSDYRNEQVKYNLDMLTIIDCGVFLKGVMSSSDEELRYLVRGVQDALQALEANGVNRKHLVLCDGDVLKLAEKVQ